jgi:fucose permease
VPAFRLSCLTYLILALPSSTLGLLWPSMRLAFHEPVGALGILLIFGIIASVAASAATGRLLALTGAGPLVAGGVLLIGLALALEAAAPSLWVFAVGVAAFGLGFGAIDAALNAYAARCFGAREINWMHASFGLGATLGPLVVTAMLSGRLGWRWVYVATALAMAGLALTLTLTRRAWEQPAAASAAAGPPPRQPESRPPTAGRPARLRVLGGLAFAAIETGIESGAGIWGYVFLTSGRGLGTAVAGLAVSAYWAMMFVGRLVLGPVAERLGADRVLGWAVAGVAAGAALMTVPGPGLLAVAGLMALGLAAAPVFPLLTLTTAERLGAVGGATTAQTVSLQVAASAVGSAALPAVIGVAIGALHATVLAPVLLVLGLAMGVLLRLLSRSPGRPGQRC